MMHLWGRVYLDFDFRVYFSQNRLVISEQYGNPFDRSSSETGFQTLHAYGHNLQDLVGQDKKYATLTAALVDIERIHQDVNKSVVIYCDKTAYVQFAARWLKAILPNSTVDSVFEILKLHIAKEKAISGFIKTGVNNIDAIWNVDAEARAVIEATFTAPIASEFDEFFDDIKSTLSIEYLLPTFLAGDTRYDRPFLDALYNLLSRKAVNEVYDWRNFIHTNIQTALVKEMFEVPDGVYDLEMVPTLVPLTNPRFWNRTGSLFPDSTNPALQLTEMTTEDAQGLVTLLSALRDPYTSGPAQPIVMTEVMALGLIPLLTKGRLLAIEAKSILQNPSFTAISLWSGDEIKKVNFYLVDMILQSDPASLSPYVLR